MKVKRSNQHPFRAQLDALFICIDRIQFESCINRIAIQLNLFKPFYEEWPRNSFGSFEDSLTQFGPFKNGRFQPLTLDDSQFLAAFIRNTITIAACGSFCSSFNSKLLFKSLCLSLLIVPHFSSLLTYSIAFDVCVCRSSQRQSPKPFCLN